MKIIIRVMSIMSVLLVISLPVGVAYEALPTERVYPDLSVLEAMLDSTPAP